MQLNAKRLQNSEEKKKNRIPTRSFGFLHGYRVCDTILSSLNGNNANNL